MTAAEPDPVRPAAEPPPAPLRLLVVDADRRVRSSLTGLLDLAEQVQVVASAGHARAALDACEAERPDAVIVDPRLPELPDGIAFIRGLRAERPGVRVVVVAWSTSLALLLGDDPGISVVAAEDGDLADRIVEALRAPGGPAGGSPGDADARLDATA
jgi:DNA-binding NarL/FixJ family response regulator